MCNIQIQTLDFEFSSKLLILHTSYDKNNVLKTMNYVLKIYMSSMTMISDTST